MRYCILLLLASCVSFTAYSQVSFEICGNGIDDDGNGLIDCADPVAICYIFGDCSTETNCQNGIDDDGDGTIDYYDSDCANDPNNPNEYIVDHPACENYPISVSFEAEPAWDSGVTTSAALGMPSVADLDQDGFPEVISINSETGWLYILDGRTGSTLNQVRVKTGQVYAYPVVGDVDGDGFGEIFTIDLNGVIRAYEHDLTLKWTQTSTFTGFGRHLGLADFNHDGKAELYYVNEIRDAATGTLLIKGSHGSSMYPSANNWYTELNAVPVAVDVLPTSGLELVLGHIIYEVNITSTAGTNGNSLVEAKNMNDAASKPSDYNGYFPADADWPNQTYSTTAVVDYNLDGNLDVILGGANGSIDGVTTAFFWDVANSAVKIFSVTRPGNTIPIMIKGTFSDLGGNSCDAGEDCYWQRGMGSISIADIDGDGQLEVAFVSGSSLYALETDFTEKWANHNDFWDSGSGTTGVSIFDINTDGAAELLYRDEIDLNIVDGNTGQLINSQISGTFCSAQTQAEYPIIADVDGDGKTEIILSCAQSQNVYGDAPATSSNRQNGFIRAYKASQGNTWSPARKVWNQFTYYNTNINDDLSIPRIQAAHHQSLNSNCSNALPLNKFLSQSSRITTCGEIVNPVPKLDFVNAGVIVNPPACTESELQVRVIFKNNGDKAVNQPIPLSFYTANPTEAYSNTDDSPYLETIYLDAYDGLKPGQIMDTTIIVNAIRGNFDLFVSLNDIGQQDEYGSPLANEAYYPLTELNGTVEECDGSPTIISKAVTPKPFEVKAILLSDNHNCAGQAAYNNGEVQVVAPDDTPFPASEYSFIWTNISNGQVISNDALVTGLDAGTYQIIVESTIYGCVGKADTVNVERLEDWPDTQVITLKVLQAVSSCAPGTADGIARVLINGTPIDESQYDIEWEEEQQAGILAIGDTATNLKAILYKVTVTSKLSGCSTSETIDMTLNLPILDNPLVEHNTSCTGSNGSITAQLVNGNPADYEFILIGLSPAQDTIVSTTPNFENLAAGIYELRAFDPATGCGKFSSGIEVEIEDQITIDDLNLEVVSPQTACEAPYDGQLRAIITNPADYDFIWYRGTVTTGPSALIVANTAITPDTLSTILTNIYTLIVTNKISGCNIALQIQLTENISTADFNYTQSAYCQQDANPTPTVATTGGTFSASPELVLNASTGEIDLAASTPGTYSVTYTIANVNGCSADTTVMVSITSSDDASFSYVQPSYCQNETNPVADITGNMGGTFSSTAGLVFANTTTGEIDLSTSSAGVYIITYTTSGACPANAGFEIEIRGVSIATSLATSNVYCEGFTITWDNFDNGIPYNPEYRVQISESKIFGDQPELVTTPYYIADQLKEGQKYYFRIGLKSTCAVNYTATDSVTLNSMPQISLPESITLSTDSVALTAVDPAFSDISSLGFTWYKIMGTDTSLVEGKNTIWVNEAGLYRVNVINPNGCEAYAETLVIEKRPQAQSITFESITDKEYGDETFILKATASSGLPVNYEVMDGQELISLSDYTVNILGVGTVSIKATQVGNEQYDAAEPLTRSFSISKAPQSIDFAALPDRLLEEGSFALAASSNAGLALTFTSSGPVVIINDKVSLLDSGQVTITASQKGNEFYLPAGPVSHTFSISRKVLLEEPLDTLHQIKIKIDTQLSDVYPLKVILYQQQNGVFSLVKQESTSTSQLLWNDLPEGIYTLKVKSENRSFLPTYLGQKLLLSEAQPFTLTQDTEVSLHPISIPEVLAEIGVRLSGVFVQTSQADNGRVQIIKNTQVEGTPIVGLTIFLVNAQNQKLVATAITDGEGEFTFPHVPAGTYQVKVDYEGLSLDASTTFAVGSQNLSLSLMAGKKISMNAKTEEGQQVTGIREDILSQLKFYPNPVEDQLYLEVPAELVGGTLEIFDSRGKRVYISTILTSKLSGSLAHLSSGYYQLQISHKGDTFSLKMLKR